MNLERILNSQAHINTIASALNAWVKATGLSNPTETLKALEIFEALKEHSKQLPENKN